MPRTNRERAADSYERRRRGGGAHRPKKTEINWDVALANMRRMLDEYCPCSDETRETSTETAV